MNYLEEHQTGFTLVETLVAITLLVFAVVGPLALVSSSLAQSTRASERITAFYLAQDALEYIHNVRDSNVRQGADWLQDLGPCIGSSGPCRIDTTEPDHSSAVQSCGVGCDRLEMGADGYGYAGTETKYTRSVSIIEHPEPSGDSITVTVTVAWGSGIFSDEVAIKQVLMNWTK